MKLQYPKVLDKVPIVVSLTNGIGENGVPIVVATYSGKCYFHEKTKRIRNADGKLIELEGKAFFGCDIAPSVSLLEGYVRLPLKEFKIYKGSRPRNPDGTVHHTELELM